MTDVPLKEHIEARFGEFEKRICVLQKYQDAALIVAKEEVDRRLESMNEFREQLQEQATTFLTKEKFDSIMDRHDVEHKVIISKVSECITRPVYELQHKILLDKIDELINWRSRQEGKQSLANIISVVALIISAIVGVMHFLK